MDEFVVICFFVNCLPFRDSCLLSGLLLRCDLTLSLWPDVFVSALIGSSGKCGRVGIRDVMDSVKD